MEQPTRIDHDHCVSDDVCPADNHDRGATIDKFVEFVRRNLDHHHLSGEYIDYLYATLDNADYSALLHVLAARYVYDGDRDQYVKRVEYYFGPDDNYPILADTSNLDNE